MPTLLPFMSNVSEAVGVSPNQDIPKDELDIFFRSARAFLPPGKDFSDLTPEELAEIQNQYRFDPLRPGMYQGITGLMGMN